MIDKKIFEPLFKRKYSKTYNCFTCAVEVLELLDVHIGYPNYEFEYPITSFRLINKIKNRDFVKLETPEDACFVLTFRAGGMYHLGIYIGNNEYISCDETRNVHISDISNEAIEGFYKLK